MAEYKYEKEKRGLYSTVININRRNHENKKRRYTSNNGSTRNSNA